MYAFMVGGDVLCFVPKGMTAARRRVRWAVFARRVGSGNEPRFEVVDPYNVTVPTRTFSRLWVRHGGANTNRTCRITMTTAPIACVPHSVQRTQSTTSPTTTLSLRCGLTSFNYGLALLSH